MSELNKVSVNASKRELIEKALQSSENEKLDLFKSIVGGGDGDGLGCPPEVAYSDSTYVRHADAL